MSQFLVSMILAINSVSASPRFSSQDLESVADSLAKEAYYSAELSRPHPDFIYADNDKNNITAVFAHQKDILPYEVAKAAYLEEVVSEIKVVGEKVIGKFVKFIDTTSTVNEAIENLRTLFAGKIHANYGALTFRDLMDDNFVVDKKTGTLVSQFLDTTGIQKLYLFNYLTDQQDFNYTNLLFQVNTQGKIIPVAIDLEHAYSLFSTARYGKMYETLFKKPIDDCLNAETLSIVQDIVSKGSLKCLSDQWKQNEEHVRKSNILLERINVLENLLHETQGNFSILDLYKKADVALY